MGLRFVLGRAGTGKTRLCLEEVRAELRSGPEGPPLVMLVPEQATLQVETELVRTPDLPGTARAQVLSFRRLAWRVFQEAGGAARAHLGELGKRMALRALLERRAEELHLFGRLAGQPGFTERLAGTVAELRLYRVDPRDLDETLAGLAATGRGQGVLALKLRDLSLIYHDFERFLAGRYIDPDDYLALLAERLPEARSFAGATVWVDGFTGFTPQEEAVLAALLRVARRVTVALCLDPRLAGRRQAETDLFHPTAETYLRLVTLAEKAAVLVEPAVRLEGSPRRFAGAPEIAHLEASLEHRPVPAYGGPVRAVRLVAAANRRAEVEAVARACVRLARDEGVRWREMAVVTRDLEAYHDLLLNTFRDYGIPVFLDQRRSVSHHPLPELIRSALETVLENWAYDPVFRYLKTDLVPVSRAAVDRLENYVLAHGIRGGRWLDEEPWPGPRRDDVAGGPDAAATASWADAVRRRATRQLVRFQRAVSGPRGLTVRETTAALYALLTDLKVPRRLEVWRQRALRAGDLDAAQEHEQVWNGVVDLLDQVVEALGDEHLPLAEYARVLEAGLEALRLGLIPPALDQVLVGSLDRSRQPELQAAFLIGVNEGVLPARLPDDEMFSDQERDTLAACGLELAPPGRVRLLHEQFLVYQALTRAGRYLWVSYALADVAGKALAPSPVIRHLKQLLPGLREESAGQEPAPGTILDWLAAPGPAVGGLVRELGQAARGGPLDPAWVEVYRWLVADEGRVRRWGALMRGLFYRNEVAPLDAATVARLFPLPVQASVSRLETFAGCPFRHLATYGLGLREREIYQVDPPGIGLFQHAALRLFVERLAARGRDWGEVEDGEARALLEQVVEDLAPELRQHILASSPRYRYLKKRLTRTLQRAVEVLNEHARRGAFRPVGVEVPFGGDAPWPGLVLDLGEGRQVTLQGRIDRLDAVTLAGRTYLRVVDYKSGARDLDLNEVYHGLALQLLVYLRAALYMAPGLLGNAAEPAGALYFPVFDPVLRREGPVADAAELALARRRKLRARGLVLADPGVIRLMDAGAAGDLLPARLTKQGRPDARSSVATPEQFRQLMDLARRRAGEAARRILAGEVAISPARLGKETACAGCSFHPVCAFDRELPGNAYRLLPGLARDELWRRVAEEQDPG